MIKYEIGPTKNLLSTRTERYQQPVIGLDIEMLGPPKSRGSGFEPDNKAVLTNRNEDSIFTACLLIPMQGLLTEQG